MTDVKKPLIILTGPTAVGKTALSIELAKKVGGEIISADSMQVYKHMDIGSAKIRPEEMQGVPHHMVDILEPEEEFNVVLFQRLVKECLKGIYDRGKLPILVGGTGFYIQSILYDIDFTDNVENTAYRRELEAIVSDKGCSFLHEMLEKVDKEAADSIHKNNVKRVIRALEFHMLTGEKISEHNEEQRKKTSAYNSCYFVLNDLRDLLYKRIDERVDLMMENGLVEEVDYLKNKGCTKDMVSMQGLGYKEILSYLNGEITLEQAVYRIKRDTRHFAKRQLTWFRREQDVIWINKNEFLYDDNSILDYILMKCEEIRKNA
ncbi:MAG: tRNA (adenosine(37)-N6)-dimethylallyltransferase MiaA [Clostridiales bacterium]|mgnify:CR=1 FL=1|nr:tRNA (adenosine(37)-N6)-dimethylallyltransferase MiaA [Clostridiales bacterium]